MAFICHDMACRVEVECGEGAWREVRCVSCGVECTEGEWREGRGQRVVSVVEECDGECGVVWNVVACEVLWSAFQTKILKN